MRSDSACIFCRIIERPAEASIVQEDGGIMAFMNIRPVNLAEFLIIAKERIVRHRPAPL